MTNHSSLGHLALSGNDGFTGAAVALMFPKFVSGTPRQKPMRVAAVVIFNADVAQIGRAPAL